MDFDNTNDVVKMTRADLLKAARKLREDLEDVLEKYLRADERIAVYLCPTDDELGPVCIVVLLLAPSRMEPDKRIVFYEQVNVYMADLPYEKLLNSLTEEVEMYLETET